MIAVDEEQLLVFARVTIVKELRVLWPHERVVLAVCVEGRRVAAGGMCDWLDLTVFDIIIIIIIKPPM